MKNIFKFGILSVIIVILSQFAFSFGVSSPYWKENPLIMYPGQTQNVALSLQNLIGNENLTFKAKIINGNEIAELIDEDNKYFVPFGSKDINMNLRVSVPLNISKAEFNVNILLEQVGSGRSDALEILAKIETILPVKIVGIDRDNPIDNGIINIKEVNGTIDNKDIASEESKNYLTNLIKRVFIAFNNLIEFMFY